MNQTRQGSWLRLPSVCVAMLPLVLATFIGASDKEEEGYLPLYRDRKPSITDLVLIYQGAIQRLPWTPEQLAPYVSARDPQSNQEKWLFDGFLFIEYWDGRGQEYMPGQGQKPARKEHWAWLLDRNFEKARGVPALEEVCRAAAGRIGKPARPRKVLLTLPTPIQGQTDWGKLDDKALDFRKAEDRVAACEWHIKNALAKWRVLAPKHLELAGFYWVNEIASEQREVLKSIAKAVHDQGLSLFWIPYWGADGAANWRELGFDAAWQQPNHFFHAHVPDKRLDEACSFARRHGMGLEMEFDRGMIRDPKVFRPRFHAYLDAFERFQAARDASIAYYECEGCLQALLWAGEPESRACHERLIRFVLDRQRKADEAAKGSRR